MSFRPACGGLLVALVVCVAGCVSPAKEGTTVTGKVSYKGKALNAGTVTFFGEGNKVASGPIDESGNYKIDAAPMGPVKISKALRARFRGDLGSSGTGLYSRLLITV